MDTLIEFDNVSKSYGSNWAVRELTLRIPAGELFACLGPNGAGKTTAIKMITGLLRPTLGTVRVVGHDMTNDSEEIRRYLSYISSIDRRVLASHDWMAGQDRGCSSIGVRGR